MKALMQICVMIGLVVGLTGIAQASGSYWMWWDDLDNMSAVYGNGTATGGGWQSAPPGRMAYKYNGTLTGGGWQALQIGYRWNPPGAGGANSYNGKPFPDLTGYDDYRMSIHNQIDYPIKVNLWLNTGYTDPGWGETATYAELTDATRWTYLKKCTWKDLVLDLDNANIWQGSNNFVGQVPYLNHVTGIGFSVAWDVADNYPYSVDIDTTNIPAPGAIILGGLGTGLFGWLRRRRAL